MKATIEQLKSKGLKFISGTVVKVYLDEDGFLRLVITFDNDDNDTIFLKLSGAELEMYHDYYTISAINRLANKATDVKTLSRVLQEANKEIRNEFLDKAVMLTVQELEPGDLIVQLDSSVYSQEATSEWTKYLLYEWK